jgi:hypothetical protein
MKKICSLAIICGDEEEERKKEKSANFVIVPICDKPALSIFATNTYNSYDKV